MQNGDRFTVFVSSTSEDLKAYRLVARDVIVSVGWHPEMMEDWGARPRRTVDECFDTLSRCQLLLLLQAFRQGWVPSVEEGGNGKDSITELEHRCAVARGIPVLTLLANDSWPGDRWERQQQVYERVEEFRKELRRSPVAFFDSENPSGSAPVALPIFAAIVERTLRRHKESTLRIPASGREESSHIYFDPASDGLLGGKTIPFLGMGIYGVEPLSAAALSVALAGNRPVHEQSLATIAEYRERVTGSREEFLANFREILKQHSTHAKPSTVHDLLAALPSPPKLIVNATFDCP
jgi:hypothetical protein